MRVRGGRYAAYFTGLELEAPRSIILGLSRYPGLYVTYPS